MGRFILWLSTYTNMERPLMTKSLMRSPFLNVTSYIRRWEDAHLQSFGSIHKLKTPTKSNETWFAPNDN